MTRKFSVLLSFLSMIFIIGLGVSYGQGRARHREPQDRSRRQPPPEQRAEPRRNPRPDYRQYAVPRSRPMPRQHPDYRYQYRRHYYQGGWYLSRPYPWRGGYVCAPGYWDWDSWADAWVWTEGYCNIPGRYPPRSSGFYFWFESGR